jgi:hypothetical protein
MSPMSRRRPERAVREEEQGGVSPRYRRAFGCVTWVNMAVLVFLLSTFLLPLPFRYVGTGEIFSEIQIRLALIGLILIVPGMALGAVLGTRTYRVERLLAMRSGAGIGAGAGLTGYLLFFVLIEGLPLLAAPLVASGLLLLYALFATGHVLARRRQAVLLAAGISVISGVVALLLNFDLLGLLGVLFATAAAAVGGLVGGVGYARAGGDEMLPPGTVRQERAR